jgi:hypothetical protein
VNNKISFSEFVGLNLSKKILYKQTGHFLKSLTSKWELVYPYTKSGFYIGCGLSIASTKAAKLVLFEEVQAAYPQTTFEWKQVFSSVIDALHDRISINCLEYNDSILFEDLFDEAKNLTTPDMQLNPQQCTQVIGQRVLLGLLLGMENKEITAKMLGTWTFPQSGKTEEMVHLPITSVEMAKQCSMDIFHDWFALGNNGKDGRNIAWNS